MASVEPWIKILWGSSLRGLDIFPINHWHRSGSSNWHQEPTRQALTIRREDAWLSLSSSPPQVVIKEGDYLCLC